MTDLENAVDRVIAGPEKKSKIMSKHEKEIMPIMKPPRASCQNDPQYRSGT
jgi:ATP-dependent Zn protease